MTCSTYSHDVRAELFRLVLDLGFRRLERAQIEIELLRVDALVLEQAGETLFHELLALILVVVVHERLVRVLVAEQMLLRESRLLGVLDGHDVNAREHAQEFRASRRLHLERRHAPLDAPDQVRQTGRERFAFFRRLLFLDRPHELVDAVQLVRPDLAVRAVLDVRDDHELAPVVGEELTHEFAELGPLHAFLERVVDGHFRVHDLLACFQGSRGIRDAFLGDVLLAGEVGLELRERIFDQAHVVLELVHDAPDDPVHHRVQSVRRAVGLTPADGGAGERIEQPPCRV